MPLLPCMVFAVLIPIFAWIFGPSVNAKALVAIGVSGLIVTAAGVALIAGMTILTFFVPAPPDSSPQGHNPGGGLTLLFVVLISLQIESLGGLLTLGSCFIGLRQAARQRQRWFWLLLAGALLPLVALVGIEVFATASQDLLGQLILLIHGIPVLLIVTACLPLAAAIVTTTYAIRRARGMREQAVVAPRPI